MNRREALKLLKGGREGIVEWNRRRDAWEQIPDLSGADLSGANLCDANLSGASRGPSDLNSADLSHLTLARVDLNYATLSFARLRAASVSRAILSGANLSDADLNGTDLSHAILSRTNFSRAKLNDAEFSGALCSRTIFAEVDLSSLNGLESVRHGSPSTIGTNTLFRSKGNIPESFLRGCGVPDVLIAYLPSLINCMEGIQFHTVFISSSHKDEEFAERLHNGLQRKGVRCWYAPHDLQIGARIRPAIDSSIQEYDKLLLVLSEESVNSQWVEQEVETALRREREQNATVLFPVRLDDAAFSVKAGWPALITNTRNIGDFRKWKEHDRFEGTFGRLLRDVKAAGGTSDGASTAPAAAP